MKKFFLYASLISLATMSFAACNVDVLPEIEEPETPEMITLQFAAEVADPATKATLTPNDGETAFNAAWTPGDTLCICAFNGQAILDPAIDALWNADKSAFCTGMTSLAGDTLEFIGLYPFAYMNEADQFREIYFGSDRKQRGCDFNSKYDVMLSQKVPVIVNHEASITLPLERQTAILYFHLTSSLSGEKVQKATLSVTGDDYIAGKFLYDDGELVSDGDSQSITLNFNKNTNPDATDFTLWFNILPCSYTSMSLTVETDTKTYTLKKNSGGSYAAGKLYKVKKNNVSWANNGTAETSYTIQFGKGVNEVPLPSTASADDFVYSGANYLTNLPISELNNVFYSSSKFLRLGSNGNPGSITLMLSNEGIVNASRVTINAQKYNAKDVNPEISFNDSPSQSVTSTDPSDFVFELNGSEISQLSISATNRTIVQSITVSYGGVTKTSLPTPANIAVDSDKKVTWDAVDKAGSYILTIDGTEYNVNSASYDASALSDDYHNITVVAVPTDTELYSNSAEGVRNDVLFSSSLPALTKPALTKGAATKTSLSVTWPLDERATNGYKCWITNGDGTQTIETKDPVTEGSVTFENLTKATEYRVYVEANAITEGTRPYAKSIYTYTNFPTVTPVTINEIDDAATYFVDNVTVAAVMTDGFYAKDATGGIIVKTDESVEVGQVKNISGQVLEHTQNNYFYFESADISNGDGTAIQFGTPVVKDGAAINAISSFGEYIKITGQYIIASGQYRRISVDGADHAPTPLNSIHTNDLSIDDYVTAEGFTLYKTTAGYVYFATTNIVKHQLDAESISPWKSSETHEKTISVSVEEGADWSFSPSSDSNWNISRDGSVLRLSPKSPNATSEPKSLEVTITHSLVASYTKSITVSQNGHSSSPIVITLENTGITKASYSSASFSVGDFDFAYTDWMKNSDNIQAKASTSNSLYNTVPIKCIKKITVTQTGTARAISMYGGTTEEPNIQITSPSVALTMEFDFSGKGYTYFSLTTPGNAVYISSISIEWEVALVQVSVLTMPTKSSYNSGESFNPAGLVLKKTMSDGTNSELAYAGNEDEFEFSPSLTTPLTSANTSVTVTYDGKSVSVPITVTPVSYQVSIDNPTGGQITAYVGSTAINNHSSVEVGSIVTLTATPDNTHQFSSWSVTSANGSVPLSGNSFVMPASNVTVNATFVAGSQDLELSFDVSSNPGSWPTTNPTTLTNYTYTLNNISYTFALKNVKCNSGYLMLSQPAVLGLPAIEGYKLIKVVASNSGGCSTSVYVGISSSSDSASYVTGGDAQKWATTSSSYTYDLSGTVANTMYYLYVTNKNAQITRIYLTYSIAQ